MLFEKNVPMQFICNHCTS